MLTLGVNILSSNIPLEASPVLDEFGGNALFGYSLRKVSGDPTFNPSTGEQLCIRVRRSSDNSEQDIGFSGGVLDTDALQLFCEAGEDAYVKIWYDQLAGSAGRTAHFATATPTQQPPIVLNGSVLTDPVTGLPAMRFSGSRYLQYTETGGSYTDSSGWSTENLTTLTAAYSLFFIGQSYRTSASGKIVEGSTTSNQVILSDDSISYRVDGGGATLSLSDDGFTNLYAWEIERDASNGLGLFKNNTDLITTTTTQAGTFELRNLGEDFSGDIFELLGYSASQTERDGLFENLDEYYTITDYAHTPTTYATSFAARVAADGGSVESTSCLIADLTPLV